MRSRARRSAGVGEIAPTAWISAFHEFRLWLFESFDPGPSLSSVLVDSRNNLTFGRRVSATAPWEGESPLRYGFSGPAIHRFAHPDRPRLIGPRRIREKRSLLAEPQRARAARFSTAPSITTPAWTYRHSATSSLRASATTIFFF